MNEPSPTTYHSLSASTAQKLGRNGGAITYRVLSDEDHQRLFLTITDNDSGGYFSKEIVCFDAVEPCLPADRSLPFSAKQLARSFKGKSANNPGFMAAILRSNGLLGPVEHKPHLHVVTGDWPAWKTAMLALQGEPYVPPTKADEAADGSKETRQASITRDDMPGEIGIDDIPSQLKGRKGRVIKPADEADHASLA